MLGRVVEGAARERELAADGAQIDDAAPALAPHARQDELAEADEAEDVGLDLPADLLHRRLLERTLETVAGVVDQHANGAVPAFNGGDGGADGSVVADVERQRPAALRLEIGDRFRTPRGRVHGPALCGERERGRTADAGR